MMRWKSYKYLPMEITIVSAAGGEYKRRASQSLPLPVIAPDCNVDRRVYMVKLHEKSAENQVKLFLEHGI